MTVTGGERVLGGEAGGEGGRQVNPPSCPTPLTPHTPHLTPAMPLISHTQLQMHTVSLSLSLSLYGRSVWGTDGSQGTESHTHNGGKELRRGDTERKRWTERGWEDILFLRPM